MINNTESDSSKVVIKYFITKMISLKYFYIGCLFLCLVFAFLYNVFTQKTYQASATISPIQNKTSSMLSSNRPFGGLEESIQTLTNIENQINSLNSFSLVYNTISSMNFEVSYFSEKSVVLKQVNELYGSLPFQITIDKSHIQPIEAKFYIDILNEFSFRLTASQKKVDCYNYVDNRVTSEDNYLKIDTICKFNETINNKMFKFSVSLNKAYQTEKSRFKTRYYFRLHHLDYLAKNYLENLKSEKVSPLASILRIQFRGQNLWKTISFLNKYMDSFLEDNLAKKNKIAVSTVKFIDSQISEISDSLSLSESALKNYRSNNQVMDLSFQGQRIYEQMTQIQTERASLQAQERYYNYVINYFKANQDKTGAGVVPPSSMNVTDPMTNQLLSELNNLNNQRSSIATGNSTEKNIFVGQIDNKIKLQIQAITENFANNLNTLSLSLNELNYREDKLSKEITKLPRTEMNMVGLQRKFNLNDVLITYLLQKRSEAAIALASNYPDYEILESARDISSEMVSPKTNINFILAFFIGLLIPTAYILIRDLFDYKIRSINDAEFLLHRPILNIIYSNKHKSDSVVAEFPKSAIAESFRNLRSNLLLKSDPGKSKVILLTSSQPSDGKSFISVNLASSIASVGFKTILIDSDLRRPNIHVKMKLDNAIGLSNYMTKTASVKEIIRKTSIDNLSIICAGPIIPNPSELMESGVLDDMIGFLKTNYDFIIIDTTPVGIVADATLMMKYATKILFVIRNNFTSKEIFTSALSTLKTNKFNNFDVVFNDLNLETSSYKHYSKYYVKN
jgi:tyrosine-protein kinase Etk/Wzc